MAGTVYSDYQKNNLRKSNVNLGIDVSRLSLDSETKTLIGDIVKILLSPYDQKLGNLRTRISKKQIQVLKELLRGLNGRLTSLDIRLDSDAVKEEIRKKATSAFDQKLTEYLSGRTPETSGTASHTRLNKSQIAAALRNNSVYEDSRDEFVENLEATFNKEIVAGIESGVWQRNAGDEIMELVSKAISELYLKLKTSYDDIAASIDELIDKSKNEFYKLVDSLKKDNRKIESLYSGYDAKKLSLFQAFTTTVIHNSKTYTRNVNLVRSWFSIRISGTIKQVRDAFGKVRRNILNAVAKARNLYKTTRYIIRAFGRDFKRIWGGKTAKSRFIGAFNIVKRMTGLGILGIYGSIRLLSRTVSFAFSAISGVASFMMTTGFKIIGGIWKVGSKLIKGAFSAVKSLVSSVVTRPIKRVNGSLVGLFRFIRNNTFARRLLKFLRTDAGAVLMGTIAAFIKVYMIDPMMEKFLGFFQTDDSIDNLPELQDPNSTNFGKFINRHKNIARLIISAANMWISVKKLFMGEESLEKKLKHAFKPFLPYVEPLVWLMKTLWNAAQIAVKWRFTTLALRSLKGKGGLLVNILGVLTGFIIDIIINSMSGNKTKGNENDPISTVIDPKVLKGIGLKSGILERVQGLKLIRTQPKSSERDRLEGRYLDLMGGITDEESSIEEAKKVLDDLEEIPNGENLTQFLQSPQWYKLLDMVGTSRLFGKPEVSEYVSKLPDWFLDADRYEQINYLLKVLMLREHRLREVRKRLSAYGEQGNRMEISDLIDSIHTTNTLQKSTSTFAVGKDRFWGRSKVTIRGFDNFIKDRGDTVPGEVSWIQDEPGPRDTYSTNKFKIASFQALAHTFAPKLVMGTEEQKKILFQIYQNEIDTLANKAMTGNDAALNQIQNIISELKDGEEKRLNELLVSAAKREAARNAKLSSEISSLERLSKTSMLVTPDEVSSILTSIVVRFIEENDIDVDKDQILHDFDLKYDAFSETTESLQEKQTSIYNPLWIRKSK